MDNVWRDVQELLCGYYLFLSILEWFFLDYGIYICGNGFLSNSILCSLIMQTFCWITDVINCILFSVVTDSKFDGIWMPLTMEMREFWLKMNFQFHSLSHHIQDNEGWLLVNMDSTERKWFPTDSNYFIKHFPFILKIS